MEKTMKPGTQVVYIPNHAEGDLSHPDVEFGFAVMEMNGAHFCRFWRKGHIGELRTKANSELAPTSLLTPCNTVDQSIIDNLLIELGYTEKG
jgi:hypothetical protein